MRTIPPIVLPPISALYGAITRTRLALYEHGTLVSKKLDRPVISIGNITTGGTGKTPLVEWVARTLTEHHKRVCILTRGYRRENPKQRVLVSDGDTVYSNAAEAGDEAFLLATKLKGIASVISDANRTAAGQDAIRHLRPDCFVLDDGFQHLQLARDLNLVAIDATNPFGGGQLLPYGQLREPLKGLKRADCLVITRTDQVKDISSLQGELSTLSRDRPIFLAHAATSDIRALTGDSFQSSKKCGAFCAIGNPESFFTHLRHDGYEVVFERSFRDHHAFSQADIDSLSADATARGADFLLTTEKDAVKLTQLHFSSSCFVLEIKLIVDNDEELKRLIIKTAEGGRPLS